MTQSRDFQTMERLRFVIDALEDPGANHRFTDVLNATSMSRSTVHRLLNGLSEEEMIRRTESGAYQIGSFFYQSLSHDVCKMAIDELIEPPLRQLNIVTGDTVYLVVRTGFKSLCVKRFEGSYPVKALTLSVGESRPLGVGAASLAIFAFLDPKTRSRLIQRNREDYAGFEFSVDQLDALGDLARKQGYSLDDTGFVRGMTALGIPIGKEDETPFFGISVAAVKDRLPPSRYPEVRDALVMAKRTLSQSLHRLNNESGASLFARAYGADPW